MKANIQQFFKSGSTQITNSSEKIVQLIPEEILGETKHSIVWKGKPYIDNILENWQNS